MKWGAGIILAFLALAVAVPLWSLLPKPDNRDDRTKIVECFENSISDHYTPDQVAYLQRYVRLEAPAVQITYEAGETGVFSSYIFERALGEFEISCSG